MFVFSRRAIQQRLHDLNEVLDHDQCDKTAARLNKPGSDRLAAMWETIFLHAFGKIGKLTSEQALATGKKPDISFSFPGESAVGLIADITAVSDEGLDKDNPIQQLSAEIAREAKKVGLPPGGIRYRTEGRREPVADGEKVFLQLPPAGQFPSLLKGHIRPFLLRAKALGAAAAPLVVRTDEISLTVSYDGSRYSSGSYPAYDHATSLNANPIMNRLKSKASKQLKGVDPEVLKGIIVCDADCANMRRGGAALPGGTFGPEAIAKEFLQRNSSFDFVIFATVRAERLGYQPGENYSNDIALVTFAKGEKAERLQLLCGALAKYLPKPVKNITNAALRCRETGIGENSIGAYQMSSNHVRVSARALVDVLSGKMSPSEWESHHGWRVNPFVLRMMEGRGIARAELIAGSDEDDDWIEFSFGERDAAMSPFTARKTSAPSE